jgi:diguanylate cyclase
LSGLFNRQHWEQRVAETFLQADLALYEAKRQGRNCAVCFSQKSPSQQTAKA